MTIWGAIKRLATAVAIPTLLGRVVKRSLRFSMVIGLIESILATTVARTRSQRSRNEQAQARKPSAVAPMPSEDAVLERTQDTIDGWAAQLNNWADDGGGCLETAQAALAAEVGCVRSTIPCTTIRSDDQNVCSTRFVKSLTRRCPTRGVVREGVWRRISESCARAAAFVRTVLSTNAVIRAGVVSSSDSSNALLMRVRLLNSSQRKYVARPLLASAIAARSSGSSGGTESEICDCETI